MVRIDPLALVLYDSKSLQIQNFPSNHQKIEKMDPMYIAVRLFEQKKYAEVAKITTGILEKNPKDEAAWTLKMRALTQQVYVDEYEIEYEGAIDQEMDESSVVASNARPGTSLRGSVMSSTARPGMTARPKSRQTGRPVSGMIRPGSRMATGKNNARVTGRSLQTGQPLTAKIGRLLRQGTASMITSPNGPFINLSRLNIAKYAQKKFLSKALFEYIFYHDHATAVALQLAEEALKLDPNDWWWHSRRGFCNYRLGLHREAEKDLQKALSIQIAPELYLFLAKIYARLDLPAQAIETYRLGSSNFPAEPSLLVGAARIYEDLGDLANSTLFYRDVLKIDAMDFEALACVAMEAFFNNQPELALRYYRRILQMGGHSPEVFINVGMCCFASNQLDLMWHALESAFPLCNKEQLGDLYYNLGYVCMCSGEMEFAKRCFRLSLNSVPNNSDALSALAQLSYHEGDKKKAITLYAASLTALEPDEYPLETLYNIALCHEESGNMSQALSYAQMALKAGNGLGSVDGDLKRLLSQLESMIHSL